MDVVLFGIVGVDCQQRTGSRQLDQGGVGRIEVVFPPPKMVRWSIAGTCGNYSPMILRVMHKFGQVDAFGLRR